MSSSICGYILPYESSRFSEFWLQRGLVMGRYCRWRSYWPCALFPPVRIPWSLLVAVLATAALVGLLTTGPR